MNQKPYNLSEHWYKGYRIYRFYNTRPFNVDTPSGEKLYFRKDNMKGYNRISCAEICRLIDSDRLHIFYGNPEKEKFYFS